MPPTGHLALTENRTSDPLVHRSVLRPLSHTHQGSAVVFGVYIFEGLMAMQGEMQHWADLRDEKTEVGREKTSLRWLSSNSIAL